MEAVAFVSSTKGQALPFVANRLQSVKGKKVPRPMLFPSEPLLAAAIAELPSGACNLAELRRSMAARYGASATCPVTTQRLLRDIARSAVEAWEGGDRAVTPFWRIVDPTTPTARLLAGGADFIRARRAEEKATRKV